jgi:hypothetical protein
MLLQQLLVQCYKQSDTKHRIEGPRWELLPGVRLVDPHEDGGRPHELRVGSAVVASAAEALLSRSRKLPRFYSVPAVQLRRIAAG